MTRIGVLGVCQVSGVGSALFHMLDVSELFVFGMVDVQRANKQDLVRRILADCDVVFSHYLPDRFGPLATDTLKKSVKNLFLLPSIVFTGFHPDCIYLEDERHLLKTPMEDYHSAIVAASYSLGLPAERAIRLFNRFVFQKLGYFDEFAKARAFVTHTMTCHGLDLAPEWPAWMAPGAFMHTFNHPKPHVLASIAKLAAVRAGLIPADTPTPELPGDALAQRPIWPVYPEIAESLGFKGSYIFKKAGMPDGSEGTHNLLSLRDFIEGSYEQYAGVPAEAFEVDAVVKVRAVLATLLT